ncbi:MAG: ChaN family lipoprotein [Cyanobacteria bacterium P01_D01_bin.73]
MEPKRSEPKYWIGRVRVLPWFLAATLVALIALQLPTQVAIALEKVAVNADFTEDLDLSETNNDEILDALKSATFVYLGEIHNRPGDRTGQIEILAALQREALRSDTPKLAISLEMFQRPFQPLLDAYLNGEIDEETLVRETEYEARWRFPWESYAPILRFARANRIPVLAANTPTEILRKVAREGLESLSGDDFRYVPPRDEIRVDNASYRAQLQGAFGHHGVTADNSDSFDRFFAAQVTWDETMAEAIADFHSRNPDHRIVSISGLGHVSYGYGIPDRVKRRIPTAEFQHCSVLFAPESRALPNAIANATDYIWRYDDELVEPKSA